MEKDFQVFLSFKHTNPDGTETRDYEFAKNLYDALNEAGFRTFFSPVTLHNLGISYNQDFIDSALDSSITLIVIATEAGNLESQWVKYEWKRFSNDILSGIKPNGQVISLVENLDIHQLPRYLRSSEVFDVSRGRLYADVVSFISNHFSGIGEPLPEPKPKSINDEKTQSGKAPVSGSSAPAPSEGTPGFYEQEAEKAAANFPADYSKEKKGKMLQISINVAKNIISKTRIIPMVDDKPEE
jgi:hypothetical protein